MRILLCLIFFFINICALYAQRSCGTPKYLEEIEKTNTSSARNILAANRFVLQQTEKFKEFKEADAKLPVIQIPVVFHILYNNAAQDVTEEQVKSQLAVLNNDFRFKNSDALKIPERFKSFAADIQIEFVLAKVDPNGRLTSGIVKKFTNVPEWVLDDKIKYNKFNGDDAWDSKSYLNIWVGNLQKTLGYSSPIGGSGEKDGIVISTIAFGTINRFGAYNLGRTAVHEVGHWLGLKHIWGDEACGDDLVEDTPPQAGFTSGCPNNFRNTCNVNKLGDMYMNYMDFTNDACLLMFTEGQKQRMRATFDLGGPRFSLLQSKALGEPIVLNAPPSEPVESAAESRGSITDLPVFKCYPNPVKDLMYLEFADPSWIGKDILLINFNGIEIKEIKITTLKQGVNITALSSGIYFIKAKNEAKLVVHKFVKI